jgi:hypothetical protein
MASRGDERVISGWLGVGSLRIDIKSALNSYSEASF